MDHTTPPLIFLSYAFPDRDRVLPYCEWLRSKGYSPWIDCEQLLPGQNWDLEISRAIDRATLVLVFISHASISRRSYVQKEVKRALARLESHLVDDIYLIPVSLDDTPIPDQLRVIQVIYDSDPACREKILAALNHQLDRLGKAVQIVQDEQHVTWTSRLVSEQWEGIPGYSFEYEYLQFASSEYPNLQEITEYIRAVIADTAADQRACKLKQDPSRFNFGELVRSRTNTYEAHCGAPTFKGRIMTVQYAAHYYYARAAHPNYRFLTFSFLLSPLFRISRLDLLFSDASRAWPIVQNLVREQLLAVDLAEPGSEPIKLDADGVHRGTEDWDDLTAFAFRESGIELLFAPYQVAPYVCGPQFAQLPYESVAALLTPAFASALDL